MGTGFVRRPASEAESEAWLMLQQVLNRLRKQDGVDDWLVRHIEKTSNQYYVIGVRPENRRTVTSERLVVTVMNDHAPADKDQGHVRGQAEVTLVASDLQHLEERLEQAVFMAGLTDNPPYGLPAPSQYPGVDLADSEMQAKPREVAERAVQQLTEALALEKDVRLSSAEVFVEESRVVIQNSMGVRGSQVQTDLLLDFVLLASGKNEEMESHIAFQRRRAADLDVPALAHRQAQYARDAIVAGTPKTGAFPVVVSDEALEELLMSSGYSPLVLRSSAQLKYQRMSTWESGKSIFTQEPSGDAFTLYSNALLPFATRSATFDDEGLPGQRALIVEKGVLSRFWATERYAEYLQIPATGRFGNMEIAAGSSAFDSLFDGEGPLYHIVAFSAMSPDPITGDFVGEIRLGYEIRNGQSLPIKGGSISGNLFDVLAAAQLSQDVVFLGDYLGPRGMRFDKVTVAGA
jgi:PmbA protein